MSYTCQLINQPARIQYAFGNAGRVEERSDATAASTSSAARIALWAVDRSFGAFEPDSWRTTHHVEIMA